LSRIFIKPLDHVLLPTKLVKKWGRKLKFFIFYFIFFVFHAVDYCCNVWILDLSSHKYFTSDFFFSDIEYLSLTYQPNLICFNFNSAVIVESIKSVWTADPQYVTGNLGWGVMLEKCQTWPIVTEVWIGQLVLLVHIYLIEGKRSTKFSIEQNYVFSLGGPGVTMLVLLCLQ